MKQKVDAMLRAAFELKASDIHLTVGVPPIFRVNGDLKRYGQDMLSPTDTEQMARAIVPEHMWTRFETDGELICRIAFPVFHASV